MRSRLTKVKAGFNRNIFLLKNTEGLLRGSGIPSAAFEAEQLIQHFSGINRLDFFTGQKIVSSRARKSVEAALKARVAGKPLSYVLKETEFFGLKFFVSPDTLIPRLETEILVEEAIKIIDSIRSLDSASLTRDFARDDSNATYSPKILDLGTGSGCIAVSLTIHRPDCRMTALDISSQALKTARKNISLYHLGKKICLLKSDLFSAFGAKKRMTFDLIITNPPYVSSEDFSGLSKEVLSEPRVALNGGPGGLSIVHRILDVAPRFMKRHAWLLMEIGAGQARSLAEKISKEKKFSNVRFIKDLNGIDRVLIAKKWTS